jgi:hypothetical protein
MAAPATKPADKASEATRRTDCFMLAPEYWGKGLLSVEAHPIPPSFQKYYKSSKSRMRSFDGTESGDIIRSSNTETPDMAGKLIIGNWKMNTRAQSAQSLVAALLADPVCNQPWVGVAAPAVYLAALGAQLPHRLATVGAGCQQLCRRRCLYR